MRTRNTRPATCPWASTPRATSTARRAPARPRPQQPRALGQERGRVRQSAQEVGGEHGVVAAKRVKVWARPAAAEQGPGEPARVALAERDPGAVDAVVDGARQLTRHLAFPEARVPERAPLLMSRAAVMKALEESRPSTMAKCLASSKVAPPTAHPMSSARPAGSVLLVLTLFVCLAHRSAHLCVNLSASGPSLYGSTSFGSPKVKTAGTRSPRASSRTRPVHRPRSGPCWRCSVPWYPCR